MYGVNIGCRAIAVLLFAAALWRAWSMRRWPSEDSDDDSGLYDIKEKRPEADALMGKFTFNSDK